MRISYNYSIRILATVLSICLCCTALTAQLTSGGTTQNDLIVCETQTTSSFSFSVGSDFTGDITLDYTLPAGIMYIDASAVVTGDGTLNTQTGGGTSTPQIVVSPDEAGWTTGENVTITITREAGCAAVGEGNQQDMVTVSGGFGADQMFSTDTYNVDEASLTLQLSEVTISTTLGAMECRNITIGQGGNGYVSTFTHRVVVGSDLGSYELRFPVGGSALTPSSSTPNMDGSTTFEYVIDFNLPPFNTAAGGDGQFNNGEDVVLEECFVVNNCNPNTAFTTHTASFGCFGEICQSSAAVSGFVNVPVSQPTVVLENNGIDAPSCFDGTTAGVSSYLVINTSSTADALVNLRSYTGTGSNFSMTTSRGTSIDTTLTVKEGMNGTEMTLLPTRVGPQLSSTDREACPVGAAFRYAEYAPLLLAAGDTLFVSFEYFQCCFEDCGSRSIDPKTLGVTTRDVCGNNPRSTQRVQRETETSNSVSGALFSGPANLSDGQTGTLCAEYAEFNFFYPQDDDGYIAFQLQLPTNLVYTNGSADLEVTRAPRGGVPLNTVNVSPILEDYNMATGMLEIRYDRAEFEQTVLDNAMTICVEVTNNCGTGGVFDIPWEVIHVPNPNCASACELETRCDDYQIQLLCPGTPCVDGGGSPIGGALARTSIGLMDDDDDRIADLPNMPADMDSIALDRVLPSDTFAISASFELVTTTANPTWAEAFFVDMQSFGEEFTVVDAKVEIYDRTMMGGTATLYTASGLSVTKTIGTAPSATFEADLTPANLATLVGSTVPSSYVYDEFDSVAVSVTYVWDLELSTGISVSTFNSPPAIELEQNTSRSQLELSNTGDPMRYSCGDILNFNYLLGINAVIGNTLSADFCSLTNTIRYSVAVGGSSRFGDDLFPEEFRPVLQFDQVRLDDLVGLVPDQITLRQARANPSSNSGFSNASNPALPLVIDAMDVDTNIVDLTQYYEDQGGFWVLKDGWGEAFRTEAILTYTKECSFFGNDVFTLDDDGNFVLNRNIGNVLVDFLLQDTTFVEPINSTSRSFSPSDVLLSSFITPVQLPPTINAATQDLQWGLQLSNTNTSEEVPNAYLQIINDSGNLTVVRVDNNGVASLPNAAGLFPLGNLAPNTTNNYDIIANQTLCTEDSIKVVVGYACSGIPTTMAELERFTPCDFDTLVYKVNPLPSQIQLQITDQPTAAIDPCTDFTIEVEVNSAQAADLIDPELLVGLPEGLNIVGTTITYPTDGTAEPITGTMVGMDSISFDLTDASAITGDSIPGTTTTLNPVAQRQAILTLTFQTDCDFSPGSTVGFTALANRPCGDPADGNGETTSSSPLTYDTGNDLNASISIDLASGFISCDGSSASVDLTYIDTNSDGNDLTTGDRDTILITLPPGLVYVANSYAGDDANAPVFVETIMQGSSQVIVLKVPNGLTVPDGNMLMSGFSLDIDVDLSTAACNQLGELDVAYVSTSDPVFCSTLMPAGNCPDDLVTVVDRDQTSTFIVKPTVENLFITEIDGTVMATFSIANLNTGLPAGESIVFELFCAEVTDDPIGTATVNGPIAAGTTGNMVSVPFDATGCSPSSVLTLRAQTTTAAGMGQCLCTDVTSVTAVLPVELTDFKATLAGDCTVQLDWETASETNNSHFEVQHSTDTKAFTAIAKVKGAGTTLEKQSYQFMHEEVKADINYYRLKQVDIDGRYEYSKIVSVRQDCQQKAALEVYPVPVERGQLLNVRYLSHQANTSFRILNMQGQVVLVIRPQSAAQQWNDLRINLSNFASGLYYLIGSDGLSQRFVVF